MRSVKRSNQGPVVTTLQIDLNSFVRRTVNTEQLKQLINAFDGKLTRKGRSRNWRLLLPLDQRKPLIEKIYQADEKSWLWLAKSLSEQDLHFSEEELVEFISRRPSITMNELMAETGCSMTEARKAFDQYEWTDETSS